MATDLATNFSARTQINMQFQASCGSHKTMGVKTVGGYHGNTFICMSSAIY